MNAEALRQMALGELLDGLVEGVDGGLATLTASGLTLDSRRLARGDLFLALRGDTHDGHDYLADAAAAGAVAALVEALPTTPVTDLPTIRVPGLRGRVGEIAARFFRQPSAGMHVTAVTGTNGKTTVSQLFAQLVRASGYACGVIGTLGASLDGSIQASTHTTPDAVELQRRLAEWAGEALPFVSMEASSHALHQGRLDGMDVDTAVFTNLTRDHLDYHGDMRAYGDAKARLFSFSTLRAAILNGSDAFSTEIAARLAPTVNRLTYGPSGSGCDVIFSRVEATDSGLRFRLSTPWGDAGLRCSLIGAFNAPNIAAALTAALEAGLPFDALVTAVARLGAVPGRMEPLRVPGAPLVVVDYAHTPDALAKVLATLRDQCTGRLLAVFGCGGDRDRGKRALMAEAVSTHADFAVLTSDNPRGEDPAAIIADVEAGMSGDYAVRIDRADAIRFAIETAAPQDCVLIAGKGHEDYQIIGRERLPFSDRSVAKTILTGAAA